MQPWHRTCFVDESSWWILFFFLIKRVCSQLKLFSSLWIGLWIALPAVLFRVTRRWWTEVTELTGRQQSQESKPSSKTNKPSPRHSVKYGPNFEQWPESTLSRSLNPYPSVDSPGHGLSKIIGYEKSILVQNDDSVDPKIMGYKGVWVVWAMGYDRVDCSSINFHEKMIMATRACTGPRKLPVPHAVGYRIYYRSEVSWKWHEVTRHLSTSHQIIHHVQWSPMSVLNYNYVFAESKLTLI